MTETQMSGSDRKWIPTEKWSGNCHAWRHSFLPLGVARHLEKDGKPIRCTKCSCPCHTQGAELMKMIGEALDLL